MTSRKFKLISIGKALLWTAKLSKLGCCHSSRSGSVWACNASFVANIGTFAIKAWLNPLRVEGSKQRSLQSQQRQWHWFYRVAYKTILLLLQPSYWSLGKSSCLSWCIYADFESAPNKLLQAKAGVSVLCRVASQEISMAWWRGEKWTQSFLKVPF